MTEREKILAGELYDPLDPELVGARMHARDLCQDINATRVPEGTFAAGNPCRVIRAL